MSIGALAEEVKRRALAEGFALAGIASVEPSAHHAFFRAWIGADRHGEMKYLARPDTLQRRRGVRESMAETRSCLVVAHEYYSDDPPGVPEERSRGVISRYARGDDYHDVMIEKLERVLSWLDGSVAGGVRGRAYVDTGPIFERELGRRAGLGWFGRNTMLIHPKRGSYFFLGALLIDVELPADAPFEEDRCGTCRACLDACPTGALLGRDADGAPVIDARRCISYLTIELRGSIPVELRPRMGNRIFGCDICQEVCPWNERFAREAGESAYRARTEFGGPALVELAVRLLDLDQATFRLEFKDSPLQRARREGLLRNVCVALGNWGSEQAIGPLQRALMDPSPMVRAHAAWALGRLSAACGRTSILERLEFEDDPVVRQELEHALARCRQA